MIGTIRKHSKWLWFIIITVVIITFVFWGANPRSGSGRGGADDFGTIRGKKITLEAYRNMRNEVSLDYFFKTGEFPDRNPKIADDVERETYLRLMLMGRAQELGIAVGDDSTAEAAAQMLRSFARNQTSLTMDVFVEKVLAPANLSADDFEHFAHDDLVIEQLQMTMGLAGGLVTPQEASSDYVREHQELSAQIVYFSASNYVSKIQVSPASVAQYYTNYLAAYRLPDRVQVSYIEFPVSNYLAKATADLTKTNLTEQVDAIFAHYGMKSFPSAKTPEEAKATIREDLFHRQALAAANRDANAFAQVVFNQSAANAATFEATAKQQGLVAHVTAPFAVDFGPQEFTPPEQFTKLAFQLTPDDPFSQPIAGPGGVYLMALVKQLPSEIPALDSIRNQVTSDYQYRLAVQHARSLGTNFSHGLMAQLAGGRTFAGVCVASGFQPVSLQPFSLTTAEVGGLEDHATVNQLKQAAFTTPIGQPSAFQETSEGGFIVLVQSRLPVDTMAMNGDLPEYSANLRHRRESESFNNWVQREANANLRDIPFFRQQAALKAAK